MSITNQSDTGFFGRICFAGGVAAKAFEQARETAGLSKEIVLHSARHTFATKVMGATGELSLVMRALGHSSAQTAMIYQHPSLERVRSVVNEGHAEALLRHNSSHTAIM